MIHKGPPIRGPITACCPNSAKHDPTNGYPVVFFPNGKGVVNEVWFDRLECLRCQIPGSALHKITKGLIKYLV